MRIISIGNFGRGWDGSICDEEHIAAELEWQGHEVVRIQRENIIGMWKAGVDFDFMLVSQWDGYPQSLKEYFPLLKMVYWAFDYQADGQEWHERLVDEADLYLSKRIADSKYPNWQWLSQDFAPRLLAGNIKHQEKDIDVLFTGSYLPWATERNEILKAVDDHFDLYIYSVTPNEWINLGLKNVHGPVMDEGLIDLYPRAVLHLSIDHTIEAGYWSDRNAQIMSQGGLVLFRYVPLSENTFKDQVEYFYNVDDCLEKIAYWLSPTQRNLLVLRESTIQSFAHYNLMVSNRVQQLLTIVGGILCAV